MKSRVLSRGVRFLCPLVLLAMVGQSQVPQEADEVDRLRVEVAELRVEVAKLMELMRELRDEIDSLSEDAGRPSVEVQAPLPRTLDREANDVVRELPVAVDMGDARVTVEQVTIEKPALTDLFGDPKEGTQPMAVIRIIVLNTSTTKKVDYLSFSSSGPLGASGAKLSDSLGNKYRQINYGFGIDVDGRTKQASIYPGRQVSDVLVFEPPVDSAESITLRLAGWIEGSEATEITLDADLFAAP